MRQSEPVPPVQHSQSGEIAALIGASTWHVRVLEVVASIDVPDAWVAAGAIRDLVWDVRWGGGFDPASAGRA